MMLDYVLCICLIILIGTVLVESRFRCHNRCSGHGYCSDYDNICYCKQGYQGIDCSERTCAVEAAWADKAYEVDKGHQWAECSNAGRCNRRTGVCECSAGYTGVACEKLKCGGTGDEGCNGHGDCITLGQTYQMVASVSGLNLPSLYEKDKLPAWEANHVTMCSCHPGYSGASCEYRLCPKGDDPMTPHTGYRTITLSVNSQDVLTGVSGSLLFHFNGESFWFPVGATLFTAAQCEAAFESLRNIDDVTCTITHSDLFLIVYTIVLKSFPVLPYETSIYTNDGNPPLSAFTCNTDELVISNSFNSVTCVVGETGTDKVYPEYTPCANRGICDFTSGVCYCFQQFSGANCASYMKAIAVATERAVSTSEVLIVESSNADFDSTILRFQTFDVASSEFRTINVDNMDRNVFNMDGAGNMNMNYGGLIIGDTNNSLSSGMTVNTGGLSVTGGVTAYTDTLVINGPVVVVTGGVSIVNGGLRVAGNSQFNDNTQVAGGFSVTKGLRLMGGLYIGAGGGTIKLGGLTVSGGLTVVSSGITVNKRGVTVFSGGMVVNGGIQLNKVKSGITVHSTVAINSNGVGVLGGVVIKNTGFVTNSGMSIYSGGLVVANATLNSGGVTLTGGLTVHALGMTVTGGMIVEDLGMTVAGTAPSQVTGGATVYASGIVVPNGLLVSTGGLVVTGGVTIPVNDVHIFCTSPVQVKSYGVLIPLGGLSVGGGGFTIIGGLSINNIGLSIVGGGLSVQASGLRVLSGGLSVITGGLSVLAGGLVVADTGLLQNDLLSIPRDGLIISGGMTVSDTGLTINAGLTVANIGLSVVGGVSVAGGLRLTGGVTLPSTGLFVTSGGMTVNNNGVRVYGGLTNAGTVGLRLDGGMTVSTLGLQLVGGLIVSDTGLNVASKLSVEASGISVTGGMTVTDTGLVVTANGLSIVAPSLFVTGGLSIGDSTTGLNVVNAMTVTTGGHIVGGWSVTTGGFRVTIGGITIGANGLRVVNGMTVASGAKAYSASGDSGVLLNGGVTINNRGLNILDTGSVAINNNGLFVSGGLALSSTGSLQLFGGLSINNVGMSVSGGGVLVANTGVSIISGGLTVASNGLTSAGATNLQINGGLTTDGQLTVGASGVKVANGLTVSTIGVLVGSKLTVLRNGITSSLGITTDVGVRVTGDTTVSSLGVSVVGGVTVVSGGVLIGGAFNALTKNTIVGGLKVSGATSVTVQSDGVYVAGDLRVNGQTYLLDGYATTSDGRLKTEVALLDNPLEKLQQVRGVTYNWIDPTWDAQSGRLPATNTTNATTSFAVAEAAQQHDELTSQNTSASTGQVRFVGVVAQDMQRVLPEVVVPIVVNGANYLGVSYSEIVPLVIEAVKELDVRTSPATRSLRRTTKLARQINQANLNAQNSVKREPIIENLIHKYFTVDETDQRVTSVRPYNGTCGCGEDALLQMLAMLQRIQHLEREEKKLLNELSSRRVIG